MHSIMHEWQLLDLADRRKADMPHAEVAANLRQDNMVLCVELRLEPFNDSGVFSCLAMAVLL